MLWPQFKWSPRNRVPKFLEHGPKVKMAKWSDQIFLNIFKLNQTQFWTRCPSFVSLAHSVTKLRFFKISKLPWFIYIRHIDHRDDQLPDGRSRPNSGDQLSDPSQVNVAWSLVVWSSASGTHGQPVIPIIFPIDNNDDHDKNFRLQRVVLTIA